MEEESSTNAFRFKEQVYTPSESAIMATAGDAITTKQAAAAAGYYTDHFVQAFSDAPYPRRPPVQVIIKRGTFARVKVVERAVNTFLQLTRNSSKAQVVVLGSGKDTNYFRLVRARESTQPFVKWVEVDYASVLNEKVAVIRAAPERFLVKVRATGDGAVELLPMDDVGDSSAFPVASSCVLLAHNLLDTNTIASNLQRVGLDTDAPTLFISECVFMYMDQDRTQVLISSLTSSFNDSCICIYEPIIGNGDAFGRTMENNLKRAGVARPQSGILKTRTIGDHFNQLLGSGFSKVVACDLYQAYQTVLSDDERRRASRCEFLDELEEFIMIMKHYCFAVASQGESSVGDAFCQVGKSSVIGFQQGMCFTKGNLS